MQARDVMRSTGLVTASPSDTVLDAVKKMYENNVGSVLVVDEQGRLVGIFTERDLVRVVAKGLDPSTTRLEEVMTRKLITARPGDSLPMIASKMVEHGIRHIPVVDEEGKLVGIISIKPVLRHVLASCSWP